jgi:hypothetical protein
MSGEPEKPESDAALTELLARWKIEPPPSSLRAKVISRMSVKQLSTPFLELRFQAATVGVALVTGVLAGALVPWPSAVDTVQIVANLW